MISCFENLPNELIYKIFRYFDYLNIHTAFSNLNHRFSELINNDSNFPITIHLSSMSKQVLKRYNETIIEPNKSRIRSIYISNEFMHEIIFPTHEKLLEFNRIEALNLTIEMKYLEELLEQLHSLPLLSSLVITTNESTNSVASVYSKIFRLPKLKYCKINISNYIYGRLELPLCTGTYSSIERFIITDSIPFETINNLISYVLQLRYLSLYVSSSFYNQTPPIFWTLLQHLTHVSLKLCDFHFALVKQLAIDVFPNVQTFHVRSERAITTEQLSAYQWQQLIQSYLFNLRVFDIEFDVCISNDDQQLQFEIEFSQFQTSFWTERKWFFSSIVDANGRDVIFYSKQPYRKQSYKLARLTNEFNLDVIEHIEISDEKTLKNCSNYFPKIKELTLTDDHCMSNISICALVNRIMPLKQLTKLSLTCEKMSFKKLVEVLSYTTNLRELGFRSMLGYTQYQTTINENELFQNVSKTNQIIKLHFHGETSLAKVQLLLTLFPRIQHLSMHIYRRYFEEIALFLLNPKNSQCLNHLSLDRGDPDPPSTASRLIWKNKFFDDYSYREGFRGEHIWW